MTDLLTRPTRTSPAAPVPQGRPLTVSATLAGLGAAAGGLVVFMAVAVTGWFLADGGAHGDTRDALRVGADAWLVGHGSHLTFGGVDYTVVPLGLTLLLVWSAFRAGRWAGRVSPPADQREIAVGAGLFSCAYVVVAIVTSVLAGTADVSGSLVLTLLGSLLVSAVSGSAGLLTGTDGWPLVREALPAWVWPVVRASLAIVLAFGAVSAAVVTASFARNAGSAASLVSQLDLKPGDAVMLALACAVLAPNAVLLGGAYVLGPGFAVGTGTAVSPSVVVLGPVPSFPLLAALPDDGATSWFAVALLVLPALVALVAVALVQRRHPVLAWDLAALRGVGAGVLAGSATGLLSGLGGGALGSGRMADIGASVPGVMVSATLSMGVGGLLGALLMTLLQRRAERRPDPADLDLTDPDVLETDDSEATVKSETPQTARTEATTAGSVPSQREIGTRDLLARFIAQSDAPTKYAQDSQDSQDAEDAQDSQDDSSEDTVQLQRGTD